MNMKKIPRYISPRVRKDSYESVYFYTFAKCASTLFSSYVLKNIEGLRHVDYANQIYHGRDLKRVVFEEKGFIYGPIRIFYRPAAPVYKKLVKPAS